MVFLSYVQAQLDRYAENPVSDDPIYRAASHLEGQFQVLPKGRLKKHDRGQAFSGEEKIQVVMFCKSLLEAFASR